MRQPSLMGFLPDLQMPLRDALRGVATLADATEEVFEPASKLLPEPLRAGFRDAMSAVGNAGRRLITAPIEPAQVRMAAEFASGRQTENDALEACATVMCYAWEHLQEGALTHRLLMSEVLLAGQLGHVGEAAGAAPGDTAARLVERIRSSQVIGRMPGVAGGVAGSERDDVDLALAAIAIWLLSARDVDMVGEARLLDLSHALVLAIRDDILDAIDHKDDLASILTNASAHL